VNACDAKARARWEQRLAAQVRDWSAADWEASQGIRERLFLARVHLESGDACWTPGEVAVVDQVVVNIGRAFDGQPERVVGGVIIKRTVASRWPLGFTWKRCLGWEGLGVVRMNDSAFSAGRAAHVLTHELGHYFEESRRLIEPFRRATGGYQFNPLGLAQLNITEYQPGGEPPNRWVTRSGLYEDFAVSFETYVYRRIGEPVAGNVLDPRRGAFFGQCLDRA
jgi:hypothetical protein